MATPLASQRLIQAPAPSRYVTLIGVALIAYAAAIITAVLLWHTPVSPVLGDNFTVGPGIVTAVLMHCMLSLYPISTDQTGVVVFYGRPLVPLNSGLCFAPFGLMQLKREPKTIIELQFPDEPEKVFRGDDKEPLPKGMVRPIRMVTKRPDETAVGILAVQMTILTNFVVQFRIVELFRFIQAIGSITEAARQLRDIGEVTLTEEITKRTTEDVIAELHIINEVLRDKIQERISDWGVVLESARMLSPDVTHTVSSAMAGIAVARATAKQTVITADATRTQLTKEGEGKAAARGAMLAAEAEGLKKKREALGVSGETILAADTAAAAFDKAQGVIAGASGGMADLMGIVTGAKMAPNPKETKEGGKA